MVRENKGTEKTIIGAFNDCYVAENRMYLRDAENTFHLFEDGELKNKKRFPMEFCGNTTCWGKMIAMSSWYRFVLIYNWETQECSVVDCGHSFLKELKFYSSDVTHSLALLMEMRNDSIILWTWNMKEGCGTCTDFLSPTLNAVPCMPSETSDMFLVSSSGFIHEVDLFAKTLYSKDLPEHKNVKEIAIAFVDASNIVVGKADGSVLVFDRKLNIREAYPEGSFAHHLIYRSGNLLTDKSLFSSSSFPANIIMKSCASPTTDHMFFVQSKRDLLEILFHGIPYTLLMRSEKLFRGCNGIFALKQFSSDSVPSMILASFAKSTSIFSFDFDSGILLDISMNFPIIRDSKTLCAKNADSGSWFVQICSNSLSLLRSVVKDFPSSEIITAGIEEKYGILLAASVEGNYVFAISESQHLLIFEILVGKSEKSISLCFNVTLTFPFSGSITVISNATNEYLVAAAGFNAKAGSVVMFTSVDLKNNSLLKKWYFPVYPELINDLRISKIDSYSWLLVGTKTGFLKIYNLSLEITEIFSQQVGYRPVNLTQISSQFLVCSNDVKLLCGPLNSPELYNFAPRADLVCIVTPNCLGQTSSQILFLEHESLCVLNSTLSVEPWLNTLLRIPNHRLIATIEDNAVVAVGPFLHIISSNGEIISSLELPLVENIKAFKPMMGSYYAISVSVSKSDRLLVIEIEELPRRKSSKPLYSMISLSSVGFPDRINDFDYVGSTEPNSFNIAVSAGKDLHVVRFLRLVESLQFVYTSTWRLQIHTLKFDRFSGILAVADERSLQTIEFCHDNLQWKRKYMCSIEVKLGSIFWLENLIILNTKMSNLLSINPCQPSVSPLDKDVFKLLDVCLSKKTVFGLKVDGNVNEYYLY